MEDKFSLIDMNIDHLPENCLMIIFDSFYDLQDLISSSQVCSKWRRLVQIRYDKITTLTFWLNRKRLPPPYNIYTRNIRFIENINVSNVFPNLKTLEALFYSQSKCTCRVVANVLFTGNPLNGLIASFICHILDEKCNVDKDQQMVKYCGSITQLFMVNSEFLDLFFNKYKFGGNLKKFGHFILAPFKVFKTYEHLMPNLEHLYTHNPCAESTRDQMILGVKELTYTLTLGDEDDWKFLSYLPDLQKLHLIITCYIEETELLVYKKNYNVRKVSLEFETDSRKVSSVIKYITTLYPNCTDLMIFCSQFILTEIDTSETIRMLPNLSYFRLPPSLNNEQEQQIIKKVTKYCQKKNRNLKLQVSKYNDVDLFEPFALRRG
ncbi:uncharacterized protein LOC128394211 isoform X2 [Panonychus citri]|uniref:uncharacterized protein LOC128394211 isoform X2 n=1 Tax=Panonychus citri TaxID=50023 RepID=UPI0023077207|nr:uncharacterized protein LOC128394211 isoform X2 [Panonychus citri]